MARQRFHPRHLNQRAALSRFSICLHRQTFDSNRCWRLFRSRHAGPRRHRKQEAPQVYRKALRLWESAFEAVAELYRARAEGLEVEPERAFALARPQSDAGQWAPCRSPCRSPFWPRPRFRTGAPSARAALSARFPVSGTADLAARVGGERKERPPREAIWRDAELLMQLRASPEALAPFGAAKNRSTELRSNSPALWRAQPAIARRPTKPANAAQSSRTAAKPKRAIFSAQLAVIRGANRRVSSNSTSYEAL